MNTLFALVLVIYSPVQAPMAENYNPPVIDKVEMKRNMKQRDCVAMMLEIQDQISPESNIEYQCHGTYTKYNNIGKQGESTIVDSESVVLVPN